MPIPDTSGVPPFADFDMLKSKINEIVQKYNNLLVNMDSLNVVSLTADHIDAGTIDAGVVTVRADYGTGAYIEIGPTGMTIFDGTKNTFTVTIGGQVTMTGATVQSASGYPKVELQPTGNLIGAFNTANQNIKFESLSSLSTPAIIFQDGLPQGSMSFDSTSGLSLSAGLNVQLISGANIILLPFGVVKVPSWNELVNDTTEISLQSELNSKANTFSGVTGTVYVASTSGGSPTTPITFSNGIRVV